MNDKKEVTKSLGEFKDFSYTPTQGKGKGGKRHPRYYIYIKNASFVENQQFPFRAGDPLMIKIKDNKLIISKVKITIEEV